MSTFPAAPGILIAGYKEDIAPDILRAPTERGMPKQRLASTHARATITCTLTFSTNSAVNAFEQWYFNTIKRIGWFEFSHPRTGATVNVRFVDGAIGPLAPLDNTGQRWRREISVEYLR